MAVRNPLGLAIPEDHALYRRERIQLRISRKYKENLGLLTVLGINPKNVLELSLVFYPLLRTRVRLGARNVSSFIRTRGFLARYRSL
jgi:hypothetical protein